MSETEINRHFVDLGKQSRKQIRRLKKGGGKLMDEVDSAVKQIAEKSGVDPKGIISVVILCRQKRQKRRSGRGGGFTFPLPLPLPFRY
jgi:hypothetical protein